jgi:CHASE3 domain sensor protein
MTSLADDLLKSRTIPELRDLISTLEKDANGKKTELQQMVGSKYHDFIQSADKIAEMKTKSDLIERQIVNFWECNQDLILKAQDLLNQTLPEQHRKSKSSDQISLFSGEFLIFIH